MSNPDSNVSSTSSMVYAVPAAILIFFITLVIFQYKIGLYLGLPIIAFLVVSGINMFSQYSSCNKINAGNAFLYGLPTIALTYIALGISAISWCRMPVASVFAPFFTGKTVDVVSNSSMNSVKNSTSNSKECCTPKRTLENIENTFPVVKGLSHGFYLIFSTMFSIIIGNGFSSAC
jgi:hypothetical protein